MPSTVRNELVKLSVSDSPWLEAGLWESKDYHTSWPDYPYVVQNLGEEVYRQYGEANISIFYVCGKDHMDKCMPHGHLMTTEHYRVGVVATGRLGQMPNDPGS